MSGGRSGNRSLKWMKSTYGCVTQIFWPFGPVREYPINSYWYVPNIMLRSEKLTRGRTTISHQIFNISQIQMKNILRTAELGRNEWPHADIIISFQQIVSNSVELLSIVDMPEHCSHCKNSKFQCIRAMLLNQFIDCFAFHQRVCKVSTMIYWSVTIIHPYVVMCIALSLFTANCAPLVIYVDVTIVLIEPIIMRPSMSSF